MDTIKVFVGASVNGDDAEAEMAQAYSIAKNTTSPVDIVHMRANHDPESAWGCWDTSLWSTPFSGFRWAIPEYCGGEGRAIYTDNDILFLGDLRELWEHDLGEDGIIAAKGQGRFCVALWDCERADKWLPPIETMKRDPLAHQKCGRMFTMREGSITKIFDRQWNNFDGEHDDIEDIKALHYTDMSTNPAIVISKVRLNKEKKEHWYDGPIREHRRADIRQMFWKYYEEALQEGYKIVDYIPETMYGKMNKQSQANYTASNGFDVTKGE